jgi:hypothetical protein
MDTRVLGDIRESLDARRLLIKELATRVNDMPPETREPLRKQLGKHALIQHLPGVLSGLATIGDVLESGLLVDEDLTTLFKTMHEDGVITDGIVRFCRLLCNPNKDGEQ